MRSPLLALSLLLALGGGAQAASCVVVRDTGERYAGIQVQRPDLVGQRFVVTRRSSERKMVHVVSRDTDFRGGYEGYELKGMAGTFLVRREFNMGTPAVAPISFEDGKVQMDWKQSRAARAIAAEDYVLDGPLTALTVTPARCR